jgi:saccharopine dehydrogenase (NADP+, L-glutamate forming)
MRNILLVGAGKSSVSLINYFSENAQAENWQLTVADSSLKAAQDKIKGLQFCSAIELDINNNDLLKAATDKADLVISLLPAHMHIGVAKNCLQLKKHLVTASYISAEMAELNEHARKKNLVFMNECGLDPGLDHMSAMKIINQVKADGGEIISFKSFCGGLVAPESNDNPWGYKFSWNPRNVILAGQSTAQYIEDGNLKFIPYNRLFLQTETIEIDGLGKFDAYANRDSLSYRKPYDLENIKTILRGTLRNQGYCKAWNVLVKLGLTDDSYKVNIENLTYKQLVDAYLPNGSKSIKNKLADFMAADADAEAIDKVEWLGLLSDIKINAANASPAQMLQNLLEEKWKLQPTDKDMIVMQHLFTVVNISGEQKKITSSLVVKGSDSVHTAMAKTVGLPAAIAAKVILNNKIKTRGVLMPIEQEVYNPVLSELEKHNIVFAEKELG